MADSGELVRRIEELESQVAFQDELYQQLNDIVARQDRELLTLRSQLKEFALRLAEARDAAGSATSDPANEVPPHY